MGIADARRRAPHRPTRPTVRTLLLDFTAIDDAAATVSGIIAAGIVPAALEMMDAEITRAVEDFVGAGYPRDAAAVLLVELDGLEAGVRAAGRRRLVASASSTARASVRVAADDAERALLWKGRKSAFGAIARIAPDYYLHDAVVPRTRLVDVLRQVVRRSRRAAAHDDERLPRRRRQPPPADRVRRARAGDLGAGARPRATRSSRACVDGGGVLSGEHGIGLEKRDAMPLVFSPTTSTRRPGCGTRSTRRVSRTPTRSSRGEPLRRAARASRRARGSDRQAERDRRRRRARRCGRRRGRPGRVPGRTGRSAARRLTTPSRSAAPAGIVSYDPADLTVTRRRRHDGGRARRPCSAPRARSARSIRVRRARPSAGCSPSGSPGSGGFAYGPLRDQVLEVRFVTADGRLVKGGGPTVKNVSGYDLPRLLVGSFGTLGVITQVIAALPPSSALPRLVLHRRRSVSRCASGTFRPSTILWDGSTTSVLLEGNADDVAGEARACRARDRATLRSCPEVRTAAGSRCRRRPSALRPCAERVRRRAVVCGDRRRHRARRGRRSERARTLRATTRRERAAGCSARPARRTSTGSGWSCPNAALMAKVHAAFDPDGKLAPGRLPFPEPRREGDGL